MHIHSTTGKKKFIRRVLHHASPHEVKQIYKYAEHHSRWYKKVKARRKK